MELNLKYESLLKSNNLTIDDLPEDSQTGIQGIKDVVGAIKMRTGRGKPVSDKIMKKLAVLDKWVCQEIRDFVNDKDTNGEIPINPDEIVDEIKNDGSGQNEPDKTGLKIDEELQALFDTGKTQLTIEELRESAKTAHKVIFDNYEDGEENGLRTSKFSLIETSDEVFELKKR